MIENNIPELFSVLLGPEQGIFPHDESALAKKHALFKLAKQSKLPFEYLINYMNSLFPTDQENTKRHEILFNQLMSFIPAFVPESLKEVDILGTTYHIKHIDISPLPYSEYKVVVLKSHDECIMIFPATKPPSKPGFMATALANVFPTSSIGGILATEAPALSREAHHHKVKLYGQSLGGGLALQWAELLSQKHQEVVLTAAFNPALPQRQVKCKGNVEVYINKNDWVSRFGGVVPKQANVFKLSPQHCDASLEVDLSLKHIQPYAADESVHIEHFNSDQFNQQNHSLAWQVFFYLFRFIFVLVFTPIICLIAAVNVVKNIPYRTDVYSPTKAHSLSPEPTLETKTGDCQAQCTTLPWLSLLRP